MITLPAITLHQPWATWIALGLKTVETRTHDRFRSLAGLWLAVHAGQQWDHAAVRLADSVRHDPSVALAACRCPFGCVVAVARADWGGWLSIAHDTAALCQSSGLWGLHLLQVRYLDPPVAARGHQGIWFWNSDDPRVAAHLRAHAEEAPAP